MDIPVANVGYDGTLLNSLGGDGEEKPGGTGRPSQYASEDVGTPRNPPGLRLVDGC